MLPWAGRPGRVRPRARCGRSARGAAWHDARCPYAAGRDRGSRPPPPESRAPGGRSQGRWGHTHTTPHYTTQLHNYRGRSQGAGDSPTQPCITLHNYTTTGGGARGTWDTTHTVHCHQGEAQHTLYPATRGRHNAHFTLPPGGGTTHTLTCHQGEAQRKHT